MMELQQRDHRFWGAQSDARATPDRRFCVRSRPARRAFCATVNERSVRRGQVVAEPCAPSRMTSRPWWPSAGCTTTGPRARYARPGCCAPTPRWRRVTATLIGDIEETGILTDAELDALAEGLLRDEAYGGP